MLGLGMHIPELLTQRQLLRFGVQSRLLRFGLPELLTQRKLVEIWRAYSLRFGVQIPGVGTWHANS